MEKISSILRFKFRWEHRQPICIVYESHAATSLHNDAKVRAGDVRSPAQHPKFRGMLRITVAAPDILLTKYVFESITADGSSSVEYFVYFLSTLQWLFYTKSLNRMAIEMLRKSGPNTQSSHQDSNPGTIDCMRP